MTLEPHQQQGKEQILNTLNKYHICYLYGETRSGKTLTVLSAVQELSINNVLFLTKKSAISSILSDYELLNPKYRITVINYESLHKINDVFDVIIYDEAHCLGAFPKPSKTQKQLKERYFHTPCIWMSGTPTVESHSSIFHQLQLSSYSPFNQFKNFYKWADNYVNKEDVKIGTHTIISYKNANADAIERAIEPIKVVMRKTATIFADVSETILTIPMPSKIANLSKRLLKERALEGADGWFLMGETPAKLQTKIHQIHNGHVIVERGVDERKTIDLDDSLVNYAKSYFKGNKIALLYYYIAEKELIKKVFGDDVTDNLDEFNTTDKNIMLYQGTTEGMNVSRAEYLVWLNFGFSGKNYLQARDRLTIKGRKENKNFFLMYENSINHKVLKALREKKDYNSKTFLKDFL